MRAPSKTVKTGSMSGALTIIIIWAITTVWPAVEIPAEVGGAITLVISGVAAWVVPDPGRRAVKS